MLRFASDVRVYWVGSRLAEVLRGACLWSTDSGIVVEVKAVGVDPQRIVRGGAHWCALGVDVKFAADAARSANALRDFLDTYVGTWARIRAAGAHVTVEWDTWPIASQLGDLD